MEQVSSFSLMSLAFVLRTHAPALRMEVGGVSFTWLSSCVFSSVSAVVLGWSDRGRVSGGVWSPEPSLHYRWNVGKCHSLRNLRVKVWSSYNPKSSICICSFPNYISTFKAQKYQNIYKVAAIKKEILPWVEIVSMLWEYSWLAYGSDLLSPNLHVPKMYSDVWGLTVHKKLHG